MAAVLIGSARIDERGKASGGQAGNQNGKELSKQAWYLHSKGWYCFRARAGALADSVLPEKTENWLMKLQLKMVFKAQKNNGWLV